MYYADARGGVRGKNGGRLWGWGFIILVAGAGAVPGWGDDITVRCARLGAVLTRSGLNRYTLAHQPQTVLIWGSNHYASV